MIDTCQANTMYSKFYSPNIIATGSSEIDESSYSHHADNDIGVAVIDRYTYYNLDFLESQVSEASSKKTLGDLFDSYDESKIHSRPGVRWDLFSGGERGGRERLVMDFFGNVQNVEIFGINNTTELKEDLLSHGKKISELEKIKEAQRKPTTSVRHYIKEHPKKDQTMGSNFVYKVEFDENLWRKRGLGALILVGFSAVWLAASRIETWGHHIP